MLNQGRRITEKRAIYSSLSIASVLHARTFTKAISVVGFHIRDNGEPIVVTSDARVYLYSNQMNSWIRVADPWYSISDRYQLHIASLLDKHSKENPIELFESLSRKHSSTQMLQSAFRRMLAVDNQLQSMAGLALAEMKMALAELLESNADYRVWLRVYAKFIAQQGSTSLASRLCQKLLRKNEDMNDSFSEVSSPL